MTNSQELIKRPLAWGLHTFAVLVLTFSFLSIDARGQQNSNLLRVGASQGPSSLGNPYTAIGPPSSLVWSAIYDALTYIDRDGELRGALATEWSNKGGRTWEFKLRQNVVFQNGEPFNADVVRANIEFLQSPSGEGLMVANEVKNIESIEIIDPYTISFTTNDIDAILPKRLSLVMIVEPWLWSSLGADAYALSPVGTGPFELLSWGQSDATIRLKAFTESWRPPLQVDEVAILNLTDSTSRLQALLSDQVDVMIGLSPDAIPTIDSGPYKLYSRRQPIVLSIAFINTRDDESPLKDKRVRQALNLAIERDEMANIILAGLAEPAHQGATRTTFGYNPYLSPYPVDRNRARELLAEAGYPQGFALTIDVLTNLTPNDSLLYQKMAQDLSHIGVNVQLNTVLFASYLRKYSSGNWGETDAFSLTWNNAPFNEVIRPVEYFSCLKPNPFFCEPAVVDLIKSSHRTIDRNERQNIVREIMAVYRDISPALWLVTFTNLTALRDNIDNFHVRYMGVEFENVTFN